MKIKLILLAILISYLVLPITAQAGVATRTIWEATKLLTINVNNNPGSELSTVKKKFAIGPGEWKVTYSEDGVEKYISTWKLPTLPDCYRNYSLCLSGTETSKDYLWAVSAADEFAYRNWTFELINPDAAELFVNDHVCSGGCNNRRTTFGQGVIDGMNDDNVNRLSITGIYGWVHGKFANEEGGSILKSGAMIPLHWRVEGRYQ